MTKFKPTRHQACCCMQQCYSVSCYVLKSAMSQLQKPYSNNILSTLCSLVASIQSSGTNTWGASTSTSTYSPSTSISTQGSSTSTVGSETSTYSKCQHWCPYPSNDPTRPAGRPDPPSTLLLIQAIGCLVTLQVEEDLSGIF